MSGAFKYLAEGSVDEVKVKLTSILATEIKKAYVKTSWNSNELIIRIEKMGTSEIKIQLKDQNNKCSIQESKRSISMMHKPFIGEVEKIVDDLLVNKLGASACP
ncbi:MAG: hypothetical protein V4591_00140 [Bdellovibrionota bacterium]